MDDPKSLDSLFKEKIFRIPDYQRGYAWQHDQLKDFWEDLINLSGNRFHYTGVLTLKLIPEIPQSAKEFWLIKDHSYQLHHIVDGQQRLTTFIIFLQAFVELIKGLPENKIEPDASIYVNETLSVAALQERYMFKIKPTGDKFRTYKFGYEVENPSYNYLRFRILGEEGGGSEEETFYTLNLSNAKTYFFEQLRQLHQQKGTEALHEVYKSLTKRFLFNEYVIRDPFDVFVAFETMNNRGKKLSDLELLKNRLIFLATLYDDKELDLASRTNLCGIINEAWKEVYHQLGRNKAHPLNDDEFLRAHWIMYFKYSRKTGRDYIQFLLKEQFTPKRVRKKVENMVVLETQEEMRADGGFEDIEEEIVEPAVSFDTQLRPTEIRDFVISLKGSVVYWFNTFSPFLAIDMSDKERLWIDRLNRIHIGYFRPLVMAILKNEQSEEARIHIFQRIERFIFIAFRLNSAMANYGSSEFYNAARELDRKETDLSRIATALDERLSYAFNEDGTLRINDFHNLLFKKFNSGSGYYGWPALRYFLYEYELRLLSESRQLKVDWLDLLKTEADRISIEHIYPQTETEYWAKSFASVPVNRRRNYNASLGNLLLLSMSINASLQNDTFEEKKQVKYDSSSKRKLRNGYSDGSHSEIEVSQEALWGPEQVETRGLQLLRFMEERWNFKIRNDQERKTLLFLNFANEKE
jgi:uncharacterized protein with ParB-like and HNH nuclease domain